MAKEKNQHPNDTEDEELRRYGDTLRQTILDDEKEYHTTITYIAAGALALFLTINDKFFDIMKSTGFCLFLISLFFLFLTLFLYLINAISDIRSNEKLRDITDEIIEGRNDRDRLDAEWKRQIKKSRFLTYSRFVMLMIGILAEIIFIVINMRGV